MALNENPDKLEDQLEVEVIDLWKISSRVINSWRRVLDREMEGMSLKPIELRILKMLQDNGESSMNVIARQMGVTSPWITMEIERLKKRGLVTKNRSQTDRRTIKISLTDEGNRLVESGVHLLVSLIKSHLEALEPEEISVLRKTLEKMDISLR